MREGFEGGPRPGETETKKEVLIKGTMGNKGIEASFHKFTEEKGLGKIDIESPEFKNLYPEFLLGNDEMSPEMNNEIFHQISEEPENLKKELDAGNREASLETIERMKRLIEKLEKGIGEV